MSQPDEGPVAPTPVGEAADASAVDASALDGSVATLNPLEPTPPAPARPSPTRDRLDVVIPALLAAVGLAAALIAWRASAASSAAGDASGAGLGAARQLAVSSIVGEGLTARATEAYLDYERARRRAELLASGGFAVDAHLARMEAASHWFLVRPEYLDRDGTFQADRQRAAILAADAARFDMNPEPHFEAADLEQARLRQLLLAGLVLALALPFLTLAEVAKGRLRLGGAVIGSATFAAALMIAAIAWV